MHGQNYFHVNRSKRQDAVNQSTTKKSSFGDEAVLLSTVFLFCEYKKKTDTVLSMK